MIIIGARYILGGSCKVNRVPAKRSATREHPDTELPPPKMDKVYRYIWPVAPLDTKALVLLFLLGLSILYWLALPHPLPSIPYNRTATWTPLGDLPSILGSVPDPGFSTWLLRQPLHHRSPLVQFFFMPFQRRPALILADHRAAQELLTRRIADFDNSAYVARMVNGIVPNHHVTLPTGPEWRRRRQLVQDTMSQQFLRNVVAPMVYDKACTLLRLWEIKCEIADGKCFPMGRDVSQGAMDAVLGFTFGAGFPSGMASQVAYFNRLQGDEESVAKIRGTSWDAETPVVFPGVEPPEEITATVGIVRAMETVMGSVSPPTLWWLLERTSLRGYLAVKKRYMSEQLMESVRRLGNHAGGGGEWVRSALDHIVAREKQASEQDGREPDFLAPEIVSEVRLFVGWQAEIGWGCAFMWFLTSVCGSGILLRRCGVRVNVDDGAVDAQVHGR